MTVALTANQLDSVAGDLMDFAEKLKAASRVAKTQKDEVLAVYNWNSAQTAITTLRMFVSKVDTSRSAAELGRPLAIGQLTARSTAKKLPTQSEAKAAAQKTFKKKKPE